MIGGLLVVCLRMSRRREVVYLVKNSVLVPCMYGHTSRPNVPYTVCKVAEDHDVK
jgi:hypothetical protein